MRHTYAVMLSLLALLSTFAAAQDGAPKFDKDALEEVLRKDHSQKVSNIYDGENDIQYTWNVEKQELCPGVDGVCSTEEL